MPLLRFATPLALSLALGAQGPDDPAKGRLSLESLAHPTQRVTYVPPSGLQWTWLPDGGLLETRVDRAQGGVTLTRLDPKTLESRPLLDLGASVKALVGAGAPEEAAKSALGRGALTWNADQSAFLIRVQEDLFLVDLGRAAGKRLVGGEEEEATFSPDGSKVAFLRGRDLYVGAVAPAQGTRLPQGGDADHFHGRLDWVYQEEIYGRGSFKGFWWAPDSRRLVYLDLDESRVPTFTLVDDRTQPQRLHPARYPKAGDPNPVARLGVVDLEGRTTWLKDPFEGQETLVVRVGWDPKGHVLACISDRVQSWMELRRFEEGGSRVLVKEEGVAWQDPEHRSLPTFLRDGSFLWESDRSGHRHLYRYDAEGRLKGPLTAGSWEVRRLHGVDEKNRLVYFEGTERNPVGRDLYKVKLEAGFPNEGLSRMTGPSGTHAALFNPTYTAYVDTFSDMLTPPKTGLLATDGKLLKVLDPGEAPAFRELRLGKVSFQQIRARDGFPLETLLVLPPDFDARKKYPVYHHVYGGPQAPEVRNQFSSRDALWYHFLAQNGYVVWVCDNRSASNKGLASAQGIHHRLGPQELQDQLDGLEWLRRQGWADMDRVALEGWSYGGFLTAYALTHAKAWKLGIVGAPVTDWRLYDSIYTERLMGTPQANPEGYEASSVLRAARDLSGKVLLFHGTLDDNVHPQNSLQFIDALQKQGLNPSLVLLPGSDHSPRQPQHAWIRYQAMWEFLQKNL